MQNASSQSEPWQLTEETLNGLLRAFDGDRDEAARHYLRLRERIIFFFTRREFVDGEALADEVLDRVARRLERGERVQSIESYAYGVARFVAQEQARLLLRAEEAGSEYARNISSSNDTTDEDALQRALEKCLGRLSSEDCGLLVEYYRYRGQQRIRHRQAIAESLGITAAILRQRMFRMRKALESCAGTLPEFAVRRGGK
jgi:DNA-directed RNA polymerase specialized sigma24 family protein